MIDFLTPFARTAFHELPLDHQRKFEQLSADYAKEGLTMQMQYIAHDEDGLEVSVRVFKELNRPVVGK